MTFQPYHYCTLVTQRSQGARGGEGSGERRGTAEWQGRGKGRRDRGGREREKWGEARAEREGWREGERRREGHQWSRERERQRGWTRDARGEVAGEEGRGPRWVQRDVGCLSPTALPPRSPLPCPPYLRWPWLTGWLRGTARQARSCRKGEEKQ